MSFYKLSDDTLVSAVSVLVKKIFTKNRSDVHYFLTDFSKYAEENAPGRLTNRMSIVLSGGYADGEIAKQVTKRGSVLLNHLSCSQEEADT